jgi:hypothetical protein
LPGGRKFFSCLFILIIFVKKANLMHYLSLIYFVPHPLHVSGICCSSSGGTHCVCAAISTCYTYTCGPGSSVGIATGHGLDGPGIESRLGARFSAPVQTGSGAHPASCTMGTGSFPGVESGRVVTLTPHPLLVPRSKNKVELYLYSP